MINLLPLETGERINAILPIREYEQDKFIFMATANGVVKKTALMEYSRPRSSGIIALTLREDDYLIDVAITNGQRNVMLFSSAGKAIRFKESDVRPMGRLAAGVRGIKLAKNYQVNALIIVDEVQEDSDDNELSRLLISTENGYGKRTETNQFSVTKRGGMGVISIQTSERNGNAIGAVQVCSDDEIMLITDGGTLVRTPVEQVSITGRNTQGVTLIKLGKHESLVQLAPIVNLDDDSDDIDTDLDTTA
jgi:DNA gyrase subunit A